MSPGMRENLFNPIPKDQPCFGSVSPVSSVKSPGFPSSAGIGVKFGCSESSSAAVAAFPLVAPEFGLGNAAGAGNDEDDEDDDAGAAAEELTGTAAAAADAPVAAAESPEPAAVFAVVSPVDDPLAVAFAAVVGGASGCRGLVSSAKLAVTAKNPATTKIAARSSTFKVRLLSTATSASHRADDSTHSSPAGGVTKKTTGLVWGPKNGVSSVSYQNPQNCADYNSRPSVPVQFFLKPRPPRLPPQSTLPNTTDTCHSEGAVCPRNLLFL